MASDFLKQVREIRGTGTPEVAPTDGMYHDIAIKTTDTDGTPRLGDGMYGSMKAMYGGVVPVVEDLDKIIIVSDNIVSVIGVADSITDVNVVSANMSAVASVALNEANINVVAADIANVNTVATNIANVNTVANSSTEVITVADNIVDVTVVAANDVNVTVVGGNMPDINTVAADTVAVNTVAGISADVTTVSTDSADVVTVASNIADVTSVADNMADVNNYARTYYGSLTIDPTITTHPTLSVGDLYFNTTIDMLKVYEVSGNWTNTVSTVNGTSARDSFVATSGQTVFTPSGGYDSGFIDVYKNGIKLVDGTDFIATDGIALTLSQGAVLNDSIETIAYGIFTLANHYTKLEADQRDALSTKWKGLWAEGLYVTNDMARDGDWLMVANKPTSDRPAPQPNGEVEHDTIDGTFLPSQYTGIVSMEHTYTMLQAGWIKSLSIKVPTYTPEYMSRVIVTNVTNNEVTVYDNPILKGGEWVSLKTATVTTTIGAQFKVKLELYSNENSAVLSGIWDSNLNDSPSAGEVYLDDSSTPTIITYNNFDLDGVDRTTELQGVVIGSTIDLKQRTDASRYLTVTVDSISTATAGETTYAVTPVLTGKDLKDGKELVSGIQQASTVPTEYGSIDNFYSAGTPTWGDITTTLNLGGLVQPVVGTEAYGIDVGFQDAYISPDWDIMSTSGSGSGGATSIGDAPNNGLRHTRRNGSWEAESNESSPTGLIDGGELNIVGGGADVEVLAGEGVKVDSYTNPYGAPAVTRLSWNRLQATIVSAGVAGNIVYLTLAEGALDGPVANTKEVVLKQYVVQPTPHEARDEVYLGYVLHNGTSWGEVSAPVVVNNSAITLHEYLKTVKGPSFTQVGGTVTQHATNFTLDREAGIVWELNRNWHIDKKDPHRESFNAQPEFQFKYVNRDFSSVTGYTSTVDLTLFDDGTGVVTNPGGIKSTSPQRLYIDQRDNYWVLVGQVLHDNFKEAVARLPLDDNETEVPALLQNAIFLGYIVGEQAKSNWELEKARFVPHSDIGGAGGGGDMLSSVYDTDGDGVVDDSAKLGGQLPSYYATFGQVNAKVNLSGDTMTGDLTVPNVVTPGLVDGRDVSVDGTKLDGIESGATADQTAAEIETLYESITNTNKYTDTSVSKLAGIEPGATQDQTGAEIKVVYEAEPNTNAFTDSDKSAILALNVNAPKELAALDIIDMQYTNGDLSKIIYAGTNNFEDFSYDIDGLSAIAHTVNGILKGNSALSYVAGNLVSVVFTAI